MKFEELKYRRCFIPLFSLCLGVFGLFLGGCGDNSSDEAKPQPGANKVVITVEDREVTLGQFDAAMKRLIPHGEEGLTTEEIFGLKRSLIHQIIDEELMVVEALARGYSVTEKEVARESREIFGDSAGEEFNAAVISRYGDIAGWREAIKRKLFVRKVIDGISSTEVKVDTEEALKYYNSNMKEYKVAERVQARMIVVASEKEAQATLKRIKKEDFSVLAIEVSKGPEAHLGGDLGSFSRGEMPPEFEDILFAMKPGKTSGILKTPYGYHIFKLEAKMEGGKLNFEDVREKITNKLIREQTDKKVKELLGTLKKKKSINVSKDIL
ncbi:MAG: peptidyl-prolyl cis-trans isomerase [Deltaproteobacteria bacterium]|nr:peptidyl-prolyl cis-trans isomerase [Deltaproteobacteria bacterium]